MDSSPAPKPGKDIWDKLTALSTPLITLVLGAVGSYATYTYNQADLRQKSLQVQAEQTQRRTEAEASRTLSQAQALEKLFPYVASDDKLKRQFGYAMFAAMGKGELAIELVRLKGDAAGIPVLQGLARSSDATVRRAASAGLVSLLGADRAKTITTLTKRYEGGSYDAVYGTRNHLSFGIGGWSGSGMSPVLVRFCQATSARRNALCTVDGKVRAGATANVAGLKSAGAEPAMQAAQDAEFKAELDRRASAIAPLVHKYGLKLPLSAALIFDTNVNMGNKIAERLGDAASAAIGGSPAAGGDEKAWVRAYLYGRKAHFLAVTQRVSSGARFRRNDEFAARIAKGDWQMALPVDRAKLK